MNKDYCIHMDNVREILSTKLFGNDWQLHQRIVDGCWQTIISFPLPEV